MDSRTLSISLRYLLLDIHILAQSGCHFFGCPIVSPLYMENETTRRDRIVIVFDPKSLYGPGLIVRA